MKTLKNKLTLLVALGLALAALCPLALVTGCATTSPEQAAAKTLTSTAITVDQAMKSWATWVAVQRVNPAADQAELLRSEGKVKNAYEKYQAAMHTARVAWAAYAATPASATALDAALAALAGCQKELIALVGALAPPAK